MNVGDMKRRISNSLGDDAKVVFEDVDMLDYINDAQMDICRKTGFLQGTKSMSVLKGQDYYDLPTDVIEVQRVTLNWTRLVRTTWQELDMLDPSRDTGQSAGVPDHFWVNGNIIGVYPPPAKDYLTPNGMWIYYSCTPTVLVNDNDIPELPLAFHEDIVLRVIAKGHEQVEDWQASQGKLSEYDKSITLTQAQLMDGSEETYPYIRDTEGPYSA